MTLPLNPYQDYKASGVPWAARIPAHWTVQRVGALLDQRNDTGYPDLPILEVSLRTGVRVRSFDESSRKQVMSDAGKYKRAAQGDIAYNMMRMWQGAVGIAPVDGLVSPAYVVARPRPHSNARYLSYLFRTQAFMAEVNKYSHGIVADRNRLYWDEFKQMPILCPLLEEQNAIADFLDWHGHQVNRYIRAKRKLITLLNEQKQAIIHNAVTRGLDPNVKLKPSGIEWLGDIPEHWESTRVKREFKNLNPKRIPLSGTERGAMTSRLYDYYGASGVIDKVDDYLFDDDLLLIAEDGANLVLRNNPLAIIARGKSWVNNHAHILKPIKGVLEYMALVMERIDYKPWITGAAQPKLTMDRLMAVRIVLPPLEEQHQILAHVDEATKALNITLDATKEEIRLLEEYRDSLITYAITGSIAVPSVHYDIEVGTHEDLATLDDLDGLIEDEELVYVDD